MRYAVWTVWILVGIILLVGCDENCAPARYKRGDIVIDRLTKTRMMVTQVADDSCDYMHVRSVQGASYILHEEEVTPGT